ncbi:MAG: TetR/AcrR family transcriptional regulator [Pseudomonadota bacterium]
MTSDISLRERPKQQRSQKTFDTILHEAALLLEEVGWDGFNTNLLAERAGYRISAVYRYFPNKLSIVSTLAQQMVAEWDAWFDDFAETLMQERDFQKVWSQYIDLYLDSLKQVPGGAAIRRAMHSEPSLYALDQADNKRLIEKLAKALRQYEPSISTAKARVLSRVLIESVVPLTDAVLESDAKTAKPLLEEVKRMHAVYMHSHGVR